MSRSNSTLRRWARSTVDVAVPLRLVLQLERVPACRSDALGGGGLGQHLKAVALSCRYGAADNKGQEPT